MASADFFQGATSSPVVGHLNHTRAPKVTAPHYLRVESEDGHLGTGNTCDWWFSQDPSPLYLVDMDGRILSANPAGETVLSDGQVTANGAGVLKFGSAECDAFFLSAVRAIAGRGIRRRAVLRQRHGGWFGAGLHGVHTEPHVVVVLRDELTPNPDAMTAIGDAFRLTASERDVLHCLLVGQCPKTVAIHLGISEHTVRAHLRSLYAKMNVRGLTGVIRLSCSLL